MAHWRQAVLPLTMPTRGDGVLTLGNPYIVILPGCRRMTKVLTKDITKEFTKSIKKTLSNTSIRAFAIILLFIFSGVGASVLINPVSAHPNSAAPSAAAPVAAAAPLT